MAAACDFVSGGMVAYDRNLNHDSSTEFRLDVKDGLLLGEQFEGMKAGEVKNGYLGSGRVISDGGIKH